MLSDKEILADEAAGRWPAEKARAWYAERPWLCGVNYVPASAVNSTEMWQHEDFDPRSISRELGWAEELGFNALRVSLPYTVWQADHAGMLARIEQFLEVADHHGLTTLPVLLDASASAGPHQGMDPSLEAGHGSAQNAWPELEHYVQRIVGAFADDPRILAWDIYKAPAQSNDAGMPLLKAAFEWVRAANPTQPLTAAVVDPSQTALNTTLEQLCDILSFQAYDALPAVQDRVARLHVQGRPLLCTEWLRRGAGSEFETHLPYFQSAKIGAFSWGLVNGKTQTSSARTAAPGAMASSSPEVWEQDLLAPDGEPYSEAEITVIKASLARATPAG